MILHTTLFGSGHLLAGFSEELQYSSSQLSDLAHTVSQAVVSVKARTKHAINGFVNFVSSVVEKHEVKALPTVFNNNNCSQESSVKWLSRYMPQSALEVYRKSFEVICRCMKDHKWHNETEPIAESEVSKLVSNNKVSTVGLNIKAPIFTPLRTFI